MKTPLHENHRVLGGRMVSFVGWDMPLQYESIFEEYWACRQKSAIFDVCHMGKFFLKGDPRSSGFDRLMTCSIVNMSLKTGRYGFMLNEKAGIIDDFIIFRLAQEEYFMIVNAINTKKDFLYITNNISSQMTIEDHSRSMGKLDLQGPLSREVLIQENFDIKDLRFYSCQKCKTAFGDIVISRSGYTGELGYEIFLDAEKMKSLWEKFLKNDNVQPAGLGARDILRVEMGYSLYGYEINETISPLEAGLLNFVDFSKEFIGRQELEQQRNRDPQKRIVYFMSQTRRAPRSGQRVFALNGQDIGQVTSGTFSPFLKRGIGIALVACQKVLVGGTILFGDNQKKDFAVVCQKPFYKNGSLKI